MFRVYLCIPINDQWEDRDRAILTAAEGQKPHRWTEAGKLHYLWRFDDIQQGKVMRLRLETVPGILPEFREQ